MFRTGGLHYIATHFHNNNNNNNTEKSTTQYLPSLFTIRCLDSGALYYYSRALKLDQCKRTQSRKDYIYLGPIQKRLNQFVVNFNRLNQLRGSSMVEVDQFGTYHKRILISLVQIQMEICQSGTYLERIRRVQDESRVDYNYLEPIQKGLTQSGGD